MIRVLPTVIPKQYPYLPLSTISIYWNLRVSNETCVDEKYCRRCELAHKRMKDFSNTFRELTV